MALAFMFLRCLFGRRFRKAFFHVVLSICEPLGSHAVSLSGQVSKKKETIRKNVGPSFVNDGTTFQLDFKGVGPPREGRKQQKKQYGDSSSF